MKTTPTRARIIAASPLVEYLRAQILSEAFLPGSRLPSIRMLMRKFNLSYGSAMRGIDQLCKQELLEKRPRHGIFVRRPSGKPLIGSKGVIGVITHYPDFNASFQGFVQHALTAIQKEAFELGYPLMSIPVGDDITRLEHHPAVSHCNAMVLLYEADSDIDDWKVSIPTVAMLTLNDFDGKISTVEIDPFHAAAQAVRYFQKYRVKNVAIVSDCRPVFRCRARIFEEYWKLAGGEITRRYESDSENLLKINFREDPKMGFFFTSGHLYQEHAEVFFTENGKMLYTASRVLSVDGKNLIMPDYQPVPTIAMDWKWMGRTIFEELVALMENPFRMPRRIYLAGKLIEPNPPK